MRLGPLILRLFKPSRRLSGFISMGWKPLLSDYWPSYEAETYNLLVRISLPRGHTLDIEI